MNGSETKCLLHLLVFHSSIPSTRRERERYGFKHICLQSVGCVPLHPHLWTSWRHGGNETRSITLGMLIIHKDLTCNRASPLLKKKWGNKYANLMWGLEKSFLRKESAGVGRPKKKTVDIKLERKRGDVGAWQASWSTGWWAFNMEMRTGKRKTFQQLVSLARLFPFRQRNNFWIDPKNLVNNTPKRVKDGCGRMSSHRSPTHTHTYNKQTDRTAVVHSERINSKVDTLTSVLPLCGMALFTHL